MTTYTITFVRSDDTHQTVTVQDIDRYAAQLAVLVRYHNVRIVSVT